MILLILDLNKKRKILGGKSQKRFI